jgi:hypothetical protein
MLGHQENIMSPEVFEKITKGYFCDRLFAYMELVGLDTIRVNYSGGGDSGGVDNMEFLPETVDSSICKSIREDCEEELTQPIYSRHGGFADGGGYSVSGVVVYDAVEKRVSISGADHFYEYDEEGEEENSHEEEWIEDVYEQTEQWTEGGYEPEYDLAYLYAKHVLKSQLPEEYHNRILLEAATSKTPVAVKYIKELCSK